MFICFLELFLRAPSFVIITDYICGDGVPSTEWPGLRLANTLPLPPVWFGLWNIPLLGCFSYIGVNFPLYTLDWMLSNSVPIFPPNGLCCAILYLLPPTFPPITIDCSYVIYCCAPRFLAPPFYIFGSWNYLLSIKFWEMISFLSLASELWLEPLICIWAIGGCWVPLCVSRLFEIPSICSCRF